MRRFRRPLARPAARGPGPAAARARAAARSAAAAGRRRRRSRRARRSRIQRGEDQYEVLRNGRPAWSCRSRRPTAWLYYLIETTGRRPVCGANSSDDRHSRAAVADPAVVELTAGRAPVPGMSVYTPVSEAELAQLARALLDVGALVRLRADRRRHREHQLLRHHHARPLRAHAVRAPAARRPAVLPRPDGAPRAPRHPLPGADRRPRRPAPSAS